MKKWEQLWEKWHRFISLFQQNSVVFKFMLSEYFSSPAARQDPLSEGTNWIWIECMHAHTVLWAPITLPVCIHLNYFSFHLRTINLFSYCVCVGVCDRLAGWFKLSRVEAFLGEMTRLAAACTAGSSLLLSSEVKGLLQLLCFHCLPVWKSLERTCFQSDGEPYGQVCGEGWSQKSCQSHIHQKSHPRSSGRRTIQI